jgi:hypothetical protein
MFITAGEKLFGRVDRVPGRFYIATPFLFFCEFPIFPGRSYLVLEGTQVDPTIFRKGSFVGFSIYWSFKSILMAWFRAVLAFVGSAGGVLAPLMYLVYFRDTSNLQARYIAVAATVVAFLCLMAYLFTRWLELASPRRVMALARHLEGKYPKAALVVQSYLNEIGLDPSTAVPGQSQGTGEPSAE